MRIWKTKAQKNKERLDILFDRLERLEHLANQTLSMSDSIESTKKHIERVERKVNYLYIVEKGIK